MYCLMYLFIMQFTYYIMPFREDEAIGIVRSVIQNAVESLPRSIACCGYNNLPQYYEKCTIKL